MVVPAFGKKLSLRYSSTMNCVDIESEEVQQRDSNSSPTSSEEKWICSSLNPLLKYMKICGLYFEICADIRWSRFLSKYALVVTILVWVNVLRTLTVFSNEDQLGPVLFWKLSILIWTAFCALGHTTWYCACRNGTFQGVLQELDSWHDFSVVVRSTVVKGCIFFWVTFVATIVLILLAYCTHNEMFEITIAPFGGLLPVSTTVNYFVKGCFLIIYVFLNSGSQLSSTFQHILAAIIRLQYIHTDAKITKALTTETEICSLEMFEDLRVERQRLGQLVNKIDAFMSILNGSCLVGASIGMVLQLYDLIWFYTSETDTTMIISWVIFNLLGIKELAATAVGGMRLNIAVRIYFAFGRLRNANVARKYNMDKLWHN